MDNNKILSAMNKLFWFKDSMDKENGLDYLRSLKVLAHELELERLEKDIITYLAIWEEK